MSEFSLTNPVPVGGRESHDHFPTPRSAILPLWSHGIRLGWWPGGIQQVPPAAVLDPSCGEGAILDFFRERGSKTYGYELHLERGEEARRRGHHVGIGDALAREWPHADLLCGNPPYGKEAARFVHKAVEWQQAGDGSRRVAILLYISFLEPAGDRGDLFDTFPPDVLILRRRPKFDGKGTNSTASAWFCWPSSGDPGEGRLVWLPP